MTRVSLLSGIGFVCLSLAVPFLASAQNCSETPGATCSNACVQHGICQAGVCVPNAPEDVITCNDNNSCTADSCDPATGCVFTPVEDRTLCDDGNPCTTNDICTSGVCGGTAKNCDDSNACTNDSCDLSTGICINKVVDCDDKNKCTIDTCDPVSGCQRTKITCDDSNECTADTCDPIQGCVFTPSVNCDDGDPCTSDSCVPGTGLCTHAPVDMCVLPVTDALQVRYAANLNIGDSVINITNTGSTDPTDPVIPDSLCANVYTFDASEEIVSCCSCLVTPNALVSLSVQGDLISNTLSPSTPTSLLINIVATDAGRGATANCNPAAVGTVSPGLRAWGTTLHALPGSPATYGVTEADFSPSGISPAELAHLTQFCGFINANGSGFGICKSCRNGGLGGAKQ